MARSNATTISIARQTPADPARLNFDLVERSDFLLTASNGGTTVTQELSLYVLRPPEISTFDAQGAPAGLDAADGSVLLRAGSSSAASASTWTAS